MLNVSPINHYFEWSGKRNLDIELTAWVQDKKGLNLELLALQHPIAVLDVKLTQNVFQILLKLKSCIFRGHFHSQCFNLLDFARLPAADSCCIAAPPGFFFPVGKICQALSSAH